MNKELKEISTMTLKPGEPLPPGARVLEEKQNGQKVVELPIKYQPIQGENGSITAWERRPREDFL